VIARAFVFSVVLLLAGAAGAQQRGPTQGFDCKLLPGGNAPIQRIAKLATPLAVRSLELIYFNKRLADLSAADFDELASVYPMCNEKSDPNAAQTIQGFRAVVEAAQRNRREAAEWIEAIKVEARRLPATREGVMRITNMWYEMEMKSPDLMPSDSRGLAEFLAGRMNELYAKAPVSRAGETLQPTVRPPASITGGAAPTVVPPRSP
jgi:hypothetical protein